MPKDTSLQHVEQTVRYAPPTVRGGIERLVPIPRSDAVFSWEKALQVHSFIVFLAFDRPVEKKWGLRQSVWVAFPYFLRFRGACT